MGNHEIQKFVHPEGEPNSPSNSTQFPLSTTQANRVTCDTFQGVVHLEWDPHAPVTPLGQLPFFIDFLKTANLYNEWLRDCPLPFKFKGPASSGVANILA